MTRKMYWNRDFLQPQRSTAPANKIDLLLHLTFVLSVHLQYILKQ